MISWLKRKMARSTPPPEKGLLLGFRKDNRQPIVVDERTLRSHVYLSGRGGQGRSTLLKNMLTQQTEAGHGWVHFDPTGDDTLRDHLASVARASGRLDDFYVLDLGRPANSNTYDVLRAGTADSRARRVLATLANIDNAGPDYAVTTADFLEVLFNAIDAAGRSVGTRELGELLMRLAEPAAFKPFLAEIPAGDPARDALSAALDALASDSVAQQLVKAVVRAAAGRLLGLARLQCNEVFSHPQPELDFEDVFTHGKMCLIRLPTMEKDAVSCTLVRMVLQDVCSAMVARGGLTRNLRTPFLVAMDSFPGYGLSDGPMAPLCDAAYSQARGLGVSLVPVLDSGNWDRLHEVYPTEHLTGNTLTKVYFQQDASVQLALQHPTMPAGELEALQPGDFVMCQGSAIVRGRVLYTDSGTPPAFTKQPMPDVDAKPRWKT